jgi:hypothetical protein
MLPKNGLSDVGVVVDHIFLYLLQMVVGFEENQHSERDLRDERGEDFDDFPFLRLSDIAENLERGVVVRVDQKGGHVSLLEVARLLEVVQELKLGLFEVCVVEGARREDDRPGPAPSQPLKCVLARKAHEIYLYSDIARLLFAGI